MGSADFGLRSAESKAKSTREHSAKRKDHSSKEIIRSLSGDWVIESLVSSRLSELEPKGAIQQALQ